MPKSKDPFLRFSRLHQCLADLLFDPSKYFVFTPWGQRIGHLAIEIILAISIAIRDDKQLILVPHIRSVNKEIFNCRFNCPTYKRKDWRRWLLKITILFSGLFHFGYNGIRSKIIKVIPFLSKIIPSIFFYPRYGIENGRWEGIKLRGANYYLDWELLLSNDYQVSLNPEQLTRGDEIRDKMGIPKDAWFVCLHVREQGYLGTGHIHRNSSISNYLPAIKNITERGGFVVRMGDPTMTPLQPMDKVIDYALSNFRSNLMDIYLMSQCSFFLGCDSGMYFLAWLFRKPSCLVNVTELAAAPPFLPEKIFIPKRFYSKQKQRFISLREELNSNKIMFNSNYIYVENTPEEILETVKEYLYFMENGKFYNSDHLQKEFYSLRSKRHKKFLKNDSNESEKKGEKDIIGGTLLSNGRVGSFYLEQCWDNSPYLQELTKLYNGKG